MDGHYDSFSSEHILHSGLEVEQAFDIAKGVDELPKPSSCACRNVPLGAAMTLVTVMASMTPVAASNFFIEVPPVVDCSLPLREGPAGCIIASKGACH